MHGLRPKSARSCARPELHNFQRKGRLSARNAAGQKGFQTPMDISIFSAPRNIPDRASFLEPITEFPTSPQRPATAAGMHVHRRYHVAPGIADLLALLAGLGEVEARA